MVWGGKAASPARGWSYLQCCALKQVTMWPLSSTAVPILLGSSLTAWPTETVRIKDFVVALPQRLGYTFTFN